MVAASSGAPTRSRRSCKRRTSRWMARHTETRVPSILAAAKNTRVVRNSNLSARLLFGHNIKKLTVPATDLDDMKVFALNLDRPKSPT